MKTTPVFFLLLTTALAQNTPTGITKTGGLGLVRAEGKLAVGPAPPVTTLTEIFSGGFTMTDYTNYTPPPPPSVTTIDVCFVSTLNVTPPDPNNRPVVTPLDAGPVMNLNGPNGMKQFPSNKFAYGAILSMSGISFPGAPPPSPPYIAPGTYTVDNGGGGADVGPFTATLTIPDPLFAWTNADANLTIDRSAGVDVQWTGGDPNSKVYIGGSVAITDPTTFRPTGGATFICLVDNSAGHYFVSSDVLTLLPPSPATPAGLPTSTLSVGDLIQARFDVPGIDTSSFSANLGGARSVTYK